MHSRERAVRCICCGCLAPYPDDADADVDARTPSPRTHFHAQRLSSRTPECRHPSGRFAVTVACRCHGALLEPSRIARHAAERASRG